MDFRCRAANCKVPGEPGVNGMKEEGGASPPLTPSLMRFCCLITEQQGLMGESVAGRGGGGGGGGGGDVI